MTQETDQDQGQPLISHLLELRTRLLKSLLVIVIFIIVLMPLANPLYDILSAPLRALLPEGSQMIATDVAGTFFAPFKLATVTAVALAMPYLLFQIWSFIAPALYQHEKRLAMPLLIASIFLFYGGIAFAYYAAFPLMFGFFSSTAPTGVAYTPDISNFLDMALKMFFAFGLAFQVPVATVLMVWSGAIEAKSLEEKRPYIIVGCFIIGAILTPPDVFSQCLLAIPMWLLFEAGLFLAKIKTKTKDAEPTS
jgi:sec-independent protein translocase protein TatC